MLKLITTILIAWLAQREPGLDGSAWSFDRGEIEAIPDGFHAIVRIELKRVEPNV